MLFFFIKSEVCGTFVSIKLCLKGKLIKCLKAFVAGIEVIACKQLTQDELKKPGAILLHCAGKKHHKIFMALFCKGILDLPVCLFTVA